MNQNQANQSKIECAASPHSRFIPILRESNTTFTKCVASFIFTAISIGITLKIKREIYSYNIVTS